MGKNIYKGKLPITLLVINQQRLVDFPLCPMPNFTAFFFAFSYFFFCNKMYIYIFENFRNKSQTQPLLEEKLQPSLQLKKNPNPFFPYIGNVK